MGVYNDARLQQYIDGVGQRLARAGHRPNLKWTFTVVDEQAVNAFALPGGYIYLTRGILPFLRDEAELAAVMGHEVGHVDARHSAGQYSKQVLAEAGLAVGSILVPATEPFLGAASVGLQLAFLKNSRGAELEADQLGVGYASTSGWDPAGCRACSRRSGGSTARAGRARGVPNWALTHPPAADRVAKVQEAVAAARAPGATATNARAFEGHLDGLIFGDSREKGLVRGNTFVHPILRFALEFPQGWEIVNSDEQVTARESEKSNTAMILQLAPKPAGSVEATARATMTAAGFTEIRGERTMIHGLPVYVGTYQGVSGNTQVAARAAHVQSGGQTYYHRRHHDGLRFRRRQCRVLESHRVVPRAEPGRGRSHSARPDRFLHRAVRRHVGVDRAERRRHDQAGVDRHHERTDPGTPPPAGTRLRVVAGG